MWNPLSKIIGRFQHRPKPRPSHSAKFVTEQPGILKLIQTIHESAQPCLVTITGSKKIFSTFLVDFQPEQGHLILNELKPNEGNTVLQHVKTLKLSGFVNGVQLAFKLNLLDYGLNRGTYYYKTDLPDRIYYPQRRSSPRIFVVDTEKIHFQAYASSDKPTFTGDIYDLSRGGICINITDLTIILERGDVIENCKMRLPDEYCITFSLAVRSIKVLNSRKTQIGGYFLSMPPKHQRKLEAFLALLERKSIRKLKN